MLRKIDKNLLILLAGLLLGVGLGFIIPKIQRGTQPIIHAQSFQIFDDSLGFAAVDFTLESLSGDTVQLADMQGRPVIVNFWATWCGPCKLEMPLIQEFFVRYSPELEVLAINFEEPIGDIQSFADELGLTFPVLLDPEGRIAELYQVRGFPTTFFIDREGIVQGVYLGTLSKSVLEGYLAKIGVGE